MDRRVIKFFLIQGIGKGISYFIFILIFYFFFFFFLNNVFGVEFVS